MCTFLKRAVEASRSIYTHTQILRVFAHKLNECFTEKIFNELEFNKILTHILLPKIRQII